MIDKLFRTIRKLDKIYCCLLVIALHHLVYGMERTANDPDYGIYNNVASIISLHEQNQPIANQTDFKPSNWTGQDRWRKTKRLDNYDRLRRYQEYKSRSKDDDYQVNQPTSANYQFRRRSDFDDDYYYPNYYPANSHYTAHHLIYPPAVQPVISLPVTTPTVIAAPPSSYYRKYHPSASRNYYHRIYPSSSATNAIRRRLAASSSLNYDTAVPYHQAPSAPNAAYYYGAGLASHNTHYAPTAYPSSHVSYPNTHGLAHVSEHDMHEAKEVHSLLPIIAVIGIGAFMIPLLTTFFTAMMSSGANCCQRQKERTNGDSLDIKSGDLYRRLKDGWNQVDKAINSQW